MHRFTLIPSRPVVALGVPALLLTGLVVLMSSYSFAHGQAHMDLFITIDLLVTVPVIYLLLIRKTSIPLQTALPVLVLGVLLGSYFLPQQGQSYLSLFKTWGLPVLELCVISFVGYQVHKALKYYKAVARATRFLHGCTRSLWAYRAGAGSGADSH